MLTTIPTEILFRIFESANTSKDLTALILCHPVLYQAFCSSPRLVAQAVLSTEGCLDQARLLLQVQTKRIRSRNAPLESVQKRRAVANERGHAPPPTEPAGETTTPNVTRLLCNARRVCSIVDFAERSTQAKGFEPLSGEQRLRLAHTLYYIWICVEASKDDAELAKYSRLLDPTELRVASDLLMWIYAFSCPGFRRAVLADFPRRWQPTLRKLHGLLKIRHPGQFVVPGTTPEDFFCSSQRAA